MLLSIAYNSPSKLLDYAKSSVFDLVPASEDVQSSRSSLPMPMRCWSLARSTGYVRQEHLRHAFPPYWSSSHDVVFLSCLVAGWRVV